MSMLPYFQNYDSLLSVWLTLSSFSAVLNLGGIVLYVLGAIGLGGIAQKRGIRNWGLAWVPIGNAWILGSVADHYERVARQREKKQRIALLVLNLVMLLLIACVTIVSASLAFRAAASGTALSDSAVMSYVLIIILLALALVGVSIACAVLTYIAYYKVYLSCSPENATLFLVLGILFNLLNPIFLFAVRNRMNGLPQDAPMPEFVPGSYYRAPDFTAAPAPSTKPEEVSTEDDADDSARSTEEKE